MATPVSIVLLTRNGAATLPDVFAAIEAQQYAAPVEIVAADTASTDRTPDLLRRHAHRVLHVEPAAFNHGATRNLAIAAASHPYIVLLVQDAVPAGTTWLAELVAPLESHPHLAATWARQIARADADPVTRWAHGRWTGSSTTPRVAGLGGSQEFDALTPRERLERCTFDNVCACVRRAVWSQHPFRNAPIGEDVEWARDVLLAGHRIAFVPGAAVVHSHQRSARYELLRTMLIHHRLRGLFGLATVPGMGPLARAVAASLRAHGASVMADAGARRRPGPWWRAVSLAVAWPLGQYVGARLFDLRVPLRGFRGV